MRQSRSGSGAAVGRGVVQERFSAFKVFVDRAREDRDPSRLFFLGSLSLAEMPQCVPLDMIDLLHRTHTFWPVLDVVLTLRIKTTVRTAWGGRDGERGHRPAGQRGSPPHPSPPSTTSAFEVVGLHRSVRRLERSVLSGAGQGTRRVERQMRKTDVFPSPPTAAPGEGGWGEGRMGGRVGTRSAPAGAGAQPFA